MVYAVTPTTLPTVGELVEAKTYTPPTVPGDGLSTPPFVRKANKVANFKGIGVCVGGSSLGENPVVGGLCMVMTEGPATVIFAEPTTAGDLVIVSTATSGYGKQTATPTEGKTFGFVLETTKIVTPTTPTTPKTPYPPTLVYCYVHMV